MRETPHWQLSAAVPLLPTAPRVRVNVLELVFEQGGRPTLDGGAELYRQVAVQALSGQGDHVQFAEDIEDLTYERKKDDWGGDEAIGACPASRRESPEANEDQNTSSQPLYPFATFTDLFPFCFVICFTPSLAGMQLIYRSLPLTPPQRFTFNFKGAP